MCGLTGFINFSRGTDAETLHQRVEANIAADRASARDSAAREGAGDAERRAEAAAQGLWPQSDEEG